MTCLVLWAIMSIRYAGPTPGPQLHVGPGVWVHDVERPWAAYEHGVPDCRRSQVCPMVPVSLVTL